MDKMHKLRHLVSSVFVGFLTILSVTKNVPCRIIESTKTVEFIGIFVVKCRRLTEMPFRHLTEGMKKDLQMKLKTLTATLP